MIFYFNFEVFIILLLKLNNEDKNVPNLKTWFKDKFLHKLSCQNSKIKTK